MFGLAIFANCFVVDFLQVPCGIEKDQKPPRCSKRCPITPLCRHEAISKVLLVGLIPFCKEFFVF